MTRAVSRYSTALLSVLATRSPAEIASLFSAGERVAELLADDEELRRFLLSPFFSFSEKKTVFVELADRFALGAPLRDLFFTLLEARRPLLFGPVLNEAQRRHRASQGIIEIEVRTAIPLDEETLGGLRPTLEKRFGKNISVRCVVTPDLLGGVQIRHGNTIYDASLRNQLRLLADSLKKGERVHA